MYCHLTRQAFDADCLSFSCSELPAHTNVVTFYGVADADKGLYIVTEYVPDGSLDKYLMENK